MAAACLLLAIGCGDATNEEAPAFTSEAARAIVAPFYDALNRPATKDVASLLGQATSDDWSSCAGNDTCLSKDKVIAAFMSRGAAVPDLGWQIQDVEVAGHQIVVRSEATGTPAGDFMGVAMTGKSFRIMAIDVHTIENGKMMRSYHVEDWAGAIAQLGATP